MGPDVVCHSHVLAQNPDNNQGVRDQVGQEVFLIVAAYLIDTQCDLVYEHYACRELAPRRTRSNLYVFRRRRSPCPARATPFCPRTQEQYTLAIMQLPAARHYHSHLRSSRLQRQTASLRAQSWARTHHPPQSCGCSHCLLRSPKMQAWSAGPEAQTCASPRPCKK